MPYLFLFLLAFMSFTSGTALYSRHPHTLAALREKRPLPSPLKYTRNPHVDPAVWDMLAPYFLPENSKTKTVLDKIFTERDPLESFQELFKSGFQMRKRPDDKVIVARHPKLKKYLIKMYLDSSPVVEWEAWKRRVDGAKVVRNAIKTLGIDHLVKAPKKWIYPIPAQESTMNSHGVLRKNFILVVEDMEILKRKKNYKAYKKKITKEHLNALYQLINCYGMNDSIYAFNIPFCKDGKIAFVDTEHSRCQDRPPLELLTKRFSHSMRAYWNELIAH